MPPSWGCDMQRLDAIIAAQAIYSELGKRLKTNDPTNARGELDAHFAAQREATGGRSFDLMVNGEEVGTYTFPKSKEKTVAQIDIDDMPAYRLWCEENGLMELPKPEAVMRWINETGELPDGATVAEVVEGGGTAKRGTLRVDFDRVRRAVGGDFAPAIEGIGDIARLEGGK